VKFGRFKVLRCQFGTFCLSFLSIWINMDVKSDLPLRTTIVISRLPCLIRMANAVTSTVELVNSVTSDAVNSFNFVMWAFASKFFLIQLVPCSDGWRRTWWQTIHIMPGLPVSSIPQCKSNRHEGTWLELFPAIGHFESIFTEPHHASEMISKVKSLKSQINTHSFFGRDHNLDRWGVQWFWIRHGGWN